MSFTYVAFLKFVVSLSCSRLYKMSAVIELAVTLMFGFWFNMDASKVFPHLGKPHKK